MQRLRTLRYFRIQKIYNMKSTLFVLATLVLFACGGSGGGGGVTANLDGFDSESAGNGVSVATKKDGSGNLIEKGYLANGAKSGMWMTYYTDKDAGRIRTIASYSNGVLNGPYLELSNRGQIETEVNYLNNKYHGTVTNYKFGRPTAVKNYKNGELDGVSIDYFSDGDIQKEINFKGGKQHGTMKWFNEDGQVTMEYEYKNGEKISGGIVKSEGE